MSLYDIAYYMIHIEIDVQIGCPDDVNSGQGTIRWRTKEKQA